MAIASRRNGAAYSEKAFAYFLSLEQARSERSGCPFFLVQAELEARPGARAHVGPAEAAALFATLRSCLRETDYVGWYRYERVVGAVLTESRNGSCADVPRVVSQRVSQALSLRLAPGDARRLRVRVDQYAASRGPELDDLQELPLSALLGEA
jgi:hypothetical protein